MNDPTQRIDYDLKSFIHLLSEIAIKFFLVIVR